jgi:hypothetical protein
MEFTNIDYYSVAAAALAAWVLGFIYYSLVSNAWLEAMGTTKEEMCGDKSKAPLVLALVAAAVMAYVLAALLDSGAAGPVDPRSGAMAGAIVWVGFVLPSMAVNNTFAIRTAMLTVIDGIYWLLALALEGAVLGAFASGMIKLPA